MSERTPAFTPIPSPERDLLLGDVTWGPEVTETDRFLYGDLQPVPGHEAIGPEATGALGGLATQKTAEQLATETAEVGEIAAAVFSGGVLAGIHKRHLQLFSVVAEQPAMDLDLESAARVEVEQAYGNFAQAA